MWGVIEAHGALAMQQTGSRAALGAADAGEASFSIEALREATETVAPDEKTRIAVVCFR